MARCRGLSDSMTRFQDARILDLEASQDVVHVRVSLRRDARGLHHPGLEKNQDSLLCRAGFGAVLRDPLSRRNARAATTIFDGRRSQGAARVRAPLSRRAHEEPLARPPRPRRQGQDLRLPEPRGQPLGISCKLPQSGEAALMLPFAKPTGYGLGKSGWVSRQLRGRNRSARRPPQGLDRRELPRPGPEEARRRARRRLRSTGTQEGCRRHDEEEAAETALRRYGARGRECVAGGERALFGFSTADGLSLGPGFQLHLVKPVDLGLLTRALES